MQKIAYTYANDNNSQQQEDNDSNKLQSSVVVDTDNDSPWWEISYSIIPWIMIFFVFYFLVFRSHEKKRKEREYRITNMLKKGEMVVTTGGIYGTIVSVDDNTSTVTIEVAPNTKIRIMRTAIADIVNKKTLLQ